MAELNVNSDSLQKLINGLDGFASTKMVVGEPIVVNDTTLIPLNDVQLGVAVGSGKQSQAGGMGAKVSPSAVLMIQNGAVKLINIKNQDTITKLLDMVPDLVDKITGLKVKPDPEAEKKADEILNK